MIVTHIDWNAHIAHIRAAENLAALDALELQLLGRKQGVLTEALKALGTAAPEERKSKGQELNSWKEKIVAALLDRKQELGHASLSRLAEDDALDITLTLPVSALQQSGHLHLIPEFIRQIEDIFGRMGFDIAEGPEIESEELSFTMLNIPANHPARDAQDTFWIDGMPGFALRPHTSPVQIRYMRDHTPPFRMICPGRVYRKDADATHSPMFHQFEGLMVGPDVSLANMKAIMEAALKELIGDNLDFRWRTGYFPFVEPGLELDMRFQNDDGTTGRWLEVVGCGMVHPKVLGNGNVDPKKYSGFAFGFGIERLLMIKHKIRDLRAFYEGDVRFLGQF